ncbi:MAG TPA: NADH-quinone oxidoreductase subunit C, partial [Chthoniobacterales bacterium]|nr:NADH-quinone oxidoreductase subunit C [Chthoniobacterales bacterium]
MKLEEAAAKLQEQFQVVQRSDFRGEITLELTLALIEPACKFAKEQLGFDFLSDLSSVDNFGDEPRFEVVYELYSMDSNIHLRLKTRVSEDHLEVPSVVHLWATANWHEREVYDMMGIRFANHPDLRRIIMWEG